MYTHIIFLFCLFFFYIIFYTILNLFPLSLDTHKIPDIGQFLPWAMRNEVNPYSTGEREHFFRASSVCTV